MPLSSFAGESGTVTYVKKFLEEVPDVKIIGSRSVTNPLEWQLLETVIETPDSLEAVNETPDSSCLGSSAAVK